MSNSTVTVISTLVSRDIRTFWRDRLNVFFAFLGPLILFCLFMVFFRHTIAQVAVEKIPGASESDAYTACDEWLFSSVATLATFTASLAVLSGFVLDRAEGRFRDYLVSPVRRWQLTMGYILATWIVSFIISVMMLAVGQIWAAVKSQPLMSVTQDLRCVGGILLGSVVFSAFNTFVVSFLSSQGGFNGYSIIAGTSMGFFSFSYVTPSSLSDSISSVLSAMPFAQVGSLIRTPATEPALGLLVNPLPAGPVQDNARSSTLHMLGVQLAVSNHDLSTWFIIVLLIGVTVVLAGLGAWRMSRTMA